MADPLPPPPSMAPPLTPIETATATEAVTVPPAPAPAPPVSSGRPSVPAPPPASMAPPVTAPLDDAPDAQGRDSIDVWLAGIEDKAADAATALAAVARKEAEEPSAWQERWAPNDLVIP